MNKHQFTLATVFSQSIRKSKVWEFHCFKRWFPLQKIIRHNNWTISFFQVALQVGLITSMSSAFAQTGLIKMISSASECVNSYPIVDTGQRRSATTLRQLTWRLSRAKLSMAKTPNSPVINLREWE